jgi:hypothetical protein
MPKFDQYHELAPDPVEYDFTAWGVKAFGVIPEPSPEQIRDFMRAQVALDADVKAKVAELDPDNPVLAPDSAADVGGGVQGRRGPRQPHLCRPVFEQAVRSADWETPVRAADHVF